MRVFASIPVILALLSGCEGADSVSNDTGEPPMVTFGIADLLTDFDARMARPRIPLDVDDVTIETCADLFAAIETRADISSASGTRSFADYTGPFTDFEACFELPLLCHAQVAEENPWRTEGLAADIYRHLDLRGIGSSFGPPRPAVSFRYTDFAIPAPEFTADGFIIETEDFHYALWLTAIADFDGNGVADVLVTVSDHAKRSNNFDISPIILSRDAIGPGIRGQRVAWAVLEGTLVTWPDDPMTCDRAN